MQNTGFSEITKERMEYKGDGFWYCEIAITGKCNFACEYCNRFKAEIDYQKIYNFISEQKDLRHIQLTGGEPTKSPVLFNLCQLIKSKNIKLGLSTNGSAPLDFYKSLNANMFSISLDDYDHDILKSRGYRFIDTIIKNISELSKKHYVNVGVVIDKINNDRIEQIVNYILELGVNDIKLSTNTHDEVIPKFSDKDYSKYPILNYRINRFKSGQNMRGISSKDNFKCELVKNDISIVGDYHYPCLVYSREGGKAIGPIDYNIKRDRVEWYKQHIPKLDPICNKYCMDFKCEYNRSINDC